VPVYQGETRTFTLDNPSTTSLPSNNWLVTKSWPGTAAIPILPNGNADPNRTPVIVTTFPVDTDWPAIAADGSAVTFAAMDNYSDIYLVRNLQSIIAAPKIPGTDVSTLAPASIADSNLVAIRTNEGGIDNFAHVPLFSQDNSLVFFTEDWNHLPAYAGGSFFSWMAFSDFDIMLSGSDGAGSDMRFANPGNQYICSVTPGGVRLIYDAGNATDFALFMTSLETETSVSGNDVANQTIEVQAEGEPISVTLGDNAIEISPDATEDFTIGDGSGTQITLPPGQVVDFPSGQPATITVSTPTSLVGAPQLPIDGSIEAVPVVRQLVPKIRSSIHLSSLPLRTRMLRWMDSMSEILSLTSSTQKPAPLTRPCPHPTFWSGIQYKTTSVSASSIFPPMAWPSKRGLPRRFPLAMWPYRSWSC